MINTAKHSLAQGELIIVGGDHAEVDQVRLGRQLPSGSTHNGTGSIPYSRKFRQFLFQTLPQSIPAGAVRRGERADGVAAGR